MDKHYEYARLLFSMYYHPFLINKVFRFFYDVSVVAFLHCMYNLELIVLVRS